MRFVFGEYDLDTERYELRRAGQAIALEPQALRVLVYLLRHAGRAVAKHDLLQTFWPGTSDAHYTEYSLRNCLHKIRQAVSEAGTQEAIIETVRGYGYRCVAAVTCLPTDPATALDCWTHPGSVTPEDVQILTGIRSQVAIAVKNLQRYEAIVAETARRTSMQQSFSPPLADRHMSGDLRTKLGGRTYQGTVLFADVIGFTAMSERMAPAEVMALLNRYFARVQKVIDENGGKIEKFSGDGVMAFWGRRHAEPRAACDAVRAALQMQRQLWFLNLDLQAEKRQPLYAGIGLHCGTFIAGNVGSADNIDVRLIGNTVHLAARIEHLAGRYQVLISEALWQGIKPLAWAIQLPPLKVKGKSKPITIYSIRGLRQQHTGYPMALPCAILDKNGGETGYGLMTNATACGKERSLRLSTTMPLTRGMVLTLQTVLPEYHEPLWCTARVVNTLPGGHKNLTFPFRDLRQSSCRLPRDIS